MAFCTRLEEENRPTNLANSTSEESLALYRANNPTYKRDWTVLLTALAYVFLDTYLTAARTFAEDSVTMGSSLGESGKWELACALYWDGCGIPRA